MKQIYRDPESAFAALDFGGQGKVTLERFLNGLVVKRVKFDVEDITEYLLKEKIFENEEYELEFDKFKKNFFPHLFHIDDNDEEVDLIDKKKEEKILFSDPAKTTIHNSKQNKK